MVIDSDDQDSSLSPEQPGGQIEDGLLTGSGISEENARVVLLQPKGQRLVTDDPADTVNLDGLALQLQDKLSFPLRLSPNQVMAGEATISLTGGTETSAPSALDRRFGAFDATPAEPVPDPIFDRIIQALDRGNASLVDIRNIVRNPAQYADIAFQAEQINRREKDQVELRLFLERAYPIVSNPSEFSSARDVNLTDIDGQMLRGFISDNISDSLIRYQNDQYAGRLRQIIVDNSVNVPEMLIEGSLLKDLRRVSYERKKILENRDQKEQAVTALQSLIDSEDTAAESIVSVDDLRDRAELQSIQSAIAALPDSVRSGFTDALSIGYASEFFTVIQFASSSAELIAQPKVRELAERIKNIYTRYDLEAKISQSLFDNDFESARESARDLDSIKGTDVIVSEYFSQIRFWEFESRRLEVLDMLREDTPDYSAINAEIKDIRTFTSTENGDALLAALSARVATLRQRDFRRSIRKQYLTQSPDLENIRSQISRYGSEYRDDTEFVTSVTQEVQALVRRNRFNTIVGSFQSLRPTGVLEQIYQIPSNSDADLQQKRTLFVLYREFVRVRQRINPEDYRTVFDIPVGILPQKPLDTAKGEYNAENPSEIPPADTDTIQELLDRLDNNLLDDDTVPLLRLNVEQTQLLLEEALNKEEQYEESRNLIRFQLALTSLLSQDAPEGPRRAVSLGDLKLLDQIKLEMENDAMQTRRLREYASEARRIIRNSTDGSDPDVGSQFKVDLQFLRGRRRELRNRLAAQTEINIAISRINETGGVLPKLSSAISESRRNEIESLALAVSQSSEGFKRAIRFSNFQEAERYIAGLPERTEIEQLQKSQETALLARIRRENSKIREENGFFSGLIDGNIEAAGASYGNLISLVESREQAVELSNTLRYWRFQDARVAAYIALSIDTGGIATVTALKKTRDLCSTQAEYEQYALLADSVRNIAIGRFKNTVRQAYIAPDSDRQTVLKLIQSYGASSEMESRELRAIRVEADVYFRRVAREQILESFITKPAEQVLNAIAKEPSRTEEAVRWKTELFQEYGRFLTLRRENRPEEYARFKRTIPDSIIAPRESRIPMEDLKDNKKAFFASLKLFRRSAWPLITTFRHTDHLNKKLENYVRTGEHRKNIEPNSAQQPRLKYTIREKSLALQRPLTRNEKRYVRSVEWLSNTTPYWVALANADKATLSEYLQMYYDDVSRKSREKLKPGAYFPALFVGAGPTNVTAMGQLFRMRPDIAMNSLVADMGDDPGGVFAFHGPGWEMNSANPIDGPFGYTLPDAPTLSEDQTVAGYANALIGRWYPGQRSGDSAARFTSINSGIPWSVDVGHFDPARYPTNERFQLATAMNAAVSMNTVAFRTEVRNVREADDGGQGKYIVTIDLYNETGTIRLRTVDVRTDVVINGTGLGEETYGYDVKGTRSESIIAEGKSQEGLKKITRFLETMNELSDRGKEDVPEMGRVIAIEGSGNGKDTLEENILGFFESQKMSLKMVEKVYVIASNRGSERFRYSKLKDLERRIFGREGIIELIEERVGDIDYTDNTRNLEYRKRKLNVYTSEDRLVRNAKGDIIEVDTVITAAGFKPTIANAYRSFIPSGDLEDLENSDAVESITLPGQPDISVGVRLKKAPGIVFLGVSSPAAFTEEKLGQLPRKSRSVLDSVGKENAVALGFRLPDVEAAMQILIQQGVFPEGYEAPKTPRKRVVVSRAKSTFPTLSTSVYNRIVNGDLHIPNNMGDAKPLLSAIVGYKLQDIEYVSITNRRYSGSFSISISRDDDNDFRFALEGENSKSIARDFFASLMGALDFKRFHQLVAFELTKMRGKNKALHLQLTIQNGRVNMAETYIQ